MKTKKIISLALILALLISLVATINVSAEVQTLGSYEMNTGEGLSAGNLVAYTNGTEGTYYRVINSFATFNFSATSSDSIIIEYDYNCLGNGSGYNAIEMPWSGNASKKITLYQHAPWENTGSWRHYKHIIDVTNGTITTYANNNATGTVATGVTNLESGFSTNAIIFYCWNNNGIGIDNLVVKQMAASQAVQYNDLADYEMNAGEGWAAGNLEAYTNGTAGTYYKVVNGFATFNFSSAISSNYIVVEYDLNNLGNPSGGNYNTLIMKWASEPSKEVTLMQHRTWDDTGSWVHYKHVIDPQNSKITTYKNNSSEGTVTSNVTNLESGFSANALYLYSWHGMGVGIDNLVIKEKVDYETLTAFQMNKNEGLTYGNSAASIVAYNNGTAGTYLRNGNGLTKFVLDTTASEKFVIEYDYCCTFTTGWSWSYIIMPSASDSSKEVEISRHNTWDESAGEWVHYKHVVDSENGTITTYKNNSSEGTVASSVTNLDSSFSSNVIYLSTWHDLGVGIDNLVVKKEKEEEQVVSCSEITVDGSNAQAVFNLAKEDCSAAVQYILASFDNDDMLVDVAYLLKQYASAQDDSVTLPLTLTGPYSKLRAFMWTEVLVPIINVTEYPSN